MSAQDKFVGEDVKVLGPLTSGVDVTPDDDNDMTFVASCLMVGTSGNVAIVFKNGLEITLRGLVPGQVYPHRAARIKATGTTATNVQAFY